MQKNVFFHSTALLDEMKAAALRMFFLLYLGVFICKLLELILSIERSEKVTFFTLSIKCIVLY